MSSAPERHNVNGGATPPKHDFDHETKNTLPNTPTGVSNEVVSNPSANPLLDGSVMWAGPGAKAAGAHSAGPGEPVPKDNSAAGGVTDSLVAKPHGRAGAAPASTGAPDPAMPGLPRTSLATSFVIEATTANAEINGGKAPSQTELRSSPVQIVGAHGTTLHSPLNDVGMASSGEQHVDSYEARELSEDEINDIVQGARAAVKEATASRGFRKDTQPSHQTLADYAKKCAQIDREIDHAELGRPKPWLFALVPHAASEQTFYAYRAALSHRAFHQLNTSLHELDVHQRAGSRDLQWRLLVLQTRRALNDWKGVRAVERTECLAWSDKEPKASHSKKEDIPRLPQQWRDQFLSVNETSRTYRYVGVLLRYCGMRPDELERGVQLEWSPGGVRVTIKGAKVRATAGQPWRTFVLDAQQLPEWFVSEVSRQNRLNVSAKPDALRAHLGRLTEKVFGAKIAQKENGPRLSAYHFRHALATDLRQSGWETEQIAAVLGESVAETAAHYGQRVRKGWLKPTMQAIQSHTVQTARVVRPLDRSGLEKVQQAKAAKSQKIRT